jgi:hypothetical protein
MSTKEVQMLFDGELQLFFVSVDVIVNVKR